MDIDISIDSVDGTQMAAKIDGWFVLDRQPRLPFTAIAFGRIGGQNIGVKLSDSTESELRGAGYEPEDVIMSLQKNLLQGNLTLPEGLKRESFADGMPS